MQDNGRGSGGGFGGAGWWVQDGNWVYKSRDNVTREGKAQRENRGLYIHNPPLPTWVPLLYQCLKIQIEGSSTFQISNQNPDAQGYARLIFNPKDYGIYPQGQLWGIFGVLGFGRGWSRDLAVGS